jgi:hypothetical protein
MTRYYGVIGNRDHIKYQGEKRPFWEFLDRQPDGFLSSLAYLPVPFGLPDMPMIGDCGAWSYKAAIIPKLGKNLVTPEWALSQYQNYFKLGDLVVAPDHMLIPGEGIDLDDRRRFNIQSAREFLPIAEAAGFRPMATVHGMDLEERLINVGRLYEIGYRHFSLGGMAARASQKRMLLESIQAISDKVRSLLPDAWIHVLGLSSPDYFAAFNQMGIDSCDGSSHFKQAFTAGTFFAYTNGKLVKHQAARPTNGEEITAPFCECLACSKLREEGIDTRSYGSNENNMGRAAHNLNMLMRAQKNAIASLTLVSCVGQKKSKPCPAKELYQSDWFLKARSYMEMQGYDWHIISAKHGLIDRDAIVEPYEQTLNNASAGECREWSDRTFTQIMERLPNGGLVRIFAGDKYREYLVPLLENAGYTVEIPLKGLGIGQQLQWFNQEIQGRRLTQLSLFQ